MTLLRQLFRSGRGATAAPSPVSISEDPAPAATAAITRPLLERIRTHPLRYVAPMSVTGLGLAGGIAASAISGSGGSLRIASLLLVGAAMADAVDGVVARFFHAASRYGMHADTITDGVAYGVAPAVMVFSLGERAHLPRLLSGAAALWTAGSVFFRLFRFARHDQAEISVGFSGLPSTGGGPMIAGATVMADVETEEAGDTVAARAIAALTTSVILGGLMVSKIWYPKLSQVLAGLNWRSLKTRTGAAFLLGAITGTITAVGPMVPLLALFGAYALSGPVHLLSQKGRQFRSRG
ncbi:MAG: CDP-alcohol phosphatidyltransferase family protein [Deltaproteobacteria bacterium]|nr:CDP-alcohol phosphatidyltransferase family protein [Deltaproteobacteria bacterium]